MTTEILHRATHKVCDLVKKKINRPLVFVSRNILSEMILAGVTRYFMTEHAASDGVPGGFQHG